MCWTGTPACRPRWTPGCGGATGAQAAGVSLRRPPAATGVAARRSGLAGNRFAGAGRSRARRDSALGERGSGQGGAAGVVKLQVLGSAVALQGKTEEGGRSMAVSGKQPKAAVGASRAWRGPGPAQAAHRVPEDGAVGADFAGGAVQAQASHDGVAVAAAARWRLPVDGIRDGLDSEARWAGGRRAPAFDRRRQSRTARVGGEERASRCVRSEKKTQAAQPGAQ